MSSKSLPLPPPPTNRLVQDVIQEQVTALPNAPAICSWDGQFTYNELDQLSSRLAAHTSSLGVGPDVIVPIIHAKVSDLLSGLLRLRSVEAL